MLHNAGTDIRLRNMYDINCNGERFEAAEMWFVRRMLRISWTSHTANEDILLKADRRRKLLTTIRLRQLQFFSHVMRKEEMEELFVTGRIEGKRTTNKHWWHCVGLSASLSTDNGCLVVHYGRSKTTPTIITTCATQSAYLFNLLIILRHIALYFSFQSVCRWRQRRYVLLPPFCIQEVCNISQNKQ